MNAVGHPPVRVFGCGRSHRRDDQLGLRVAERLAKDCAVGVEVNVSEAPGGDLLTRLDECELMIVIDATAQGPYLASGEWSRFHYGRARGARIASCNPADLESGHFFGVQAALELGRELRLLPRHVWVYVMAGRDFGYGEELSPGLDEAVERLAVRIRRDIEGWRRARRREHA